MSGPDVLAGYVVVSATHTFVNSVASLPSALAHPVETMNGTARWLDGLFLDNRPATQVARENYTTFQSSTPRQIAQGAGHYGANVGMLVGPARFAGGRTAFVSRPGYFDNMPNRVETRTVDVSYARPSSFRKGVRDQVWEAARGSDGMVRSPGGQIMNSSEPWDMGHKPGYEFRKHQQSAIQRGISRKAFLDEYNDPTHYRPEPPSYNRSHRGEDLTDAYFGY